MIVLQRIAPCRAPTVNRRWSPGFSGGAAVRALPSLTRSAKDRRAPDDGTLVVNVLTDPHHQAAAMRI